MYTPSGLILPVDCLLLYARLPCVLSVPCRNTSSCTHLHCPNPVAFLVSLMIISLSLFLGQDFLCASLGRGNFDCVNWRSDNCGASRMLQLEIMLFCFATFELLIDNYILCLSCSISSSMCFSPIPQFISGCPRVVMVETTHWWHPWWHSCVTPGL